MGRIRNVVPFTGILLLSAAVAPGCGSSLPDNLGRVSGQVTLDGAPLPDALVTFAPQDPSGSTMLAKTDSNGNYHGEAHLGQHTVTIVTYRAGNPDSDPPREPVPEKVPANYNVKTELKVEVKPGDNKHDFPLKPGPVVQPPTTGPDG